MSDYPFRVIQRTISVENAQFGVSALGELVANEPITQSITTQYAITNQIFSCAIGRGPFRSRGYTRPFAYTRRRTTTPGTGAIPSINILSSTGALIGRIRTDVQNTIVSGLEFTIVNGDCRDFVLELNTLPDIPLAPFSIVQINVADSSFNWFIGKITDQQVEGTRNGRKYIYKGEGYSQSDMKFLVMDDSSNYAAATDVGLIVEDIVTNQLVTASRINYNPTKLDNATGVFTANEIQPGKSKISEFLDTLAAMANYEWGIDGDGDFFFQPVNDDVVRTFFVGYELNDFTPRQNLKDIRNSIVLQRQQGKGSGGAGWVISSILNDDTSIAKYGKREYRFQAPGFFSDADLLLVGNRLLEDYKNPRISATASGFQVTDESSFIRRGLSRFVLPFDRYPKTYNEVEDKDEWIVTDSSIVLEDETSILVFGASALKVSVNGSSGGRLELDQNFVGLIDKVRFWIRGSTTGTFLTVGIGLTLWDENTRAISIPVQDSYFCFDWDTSSLNLTEINKFAIRIDTDDELEFYLDKIEFVVKGNPFYNLKNTKQTYRFYPEDQSVDMELDRVPSKMEDYINNILRLAEENKFVSEVRT
jgi:hypothetical protein